MTNAILHPRSSILQRRGFTFAEVLFAVILLGIGFIMLAGMFPVAIAQTQETISETTAANLAQNAAAYVEQNGNSLLLPDTRGSFMRLRTLVDYTAPNDNTLAENYADDLWEQIRGNAIADTDPRYAWTAIYRRNGNDLAAQLTVFVVRVREYDTYTLDDLHGGASADAGTPRFPATFEPRMVNVCIERAGTDPNDTEVTADRIWIYPFDNTASGVPAPYRHEFNGWDFVGEGSYVVIANDPAGGQVVGSVYRLGARLDSGSDSPVRNPTNTTGAPKLFELIPGNDTTSFDDNIPFLNGGPLAQAYVVGKGWPEKPSAATASAPRDTDENGNPWFGDAASPGNGTVQDVGVFTTYINIK